MPPLSRRQFGSLTAATVVASLLRVRPERDLHRAIKKFCDREPSRRFDLTAPFVVSGLAYGTDGRALARIVTNVSDTTVTTRKLPNVAMAMDTHWQPERIWRPLPPEALSDAEGICPRCREMDLPKCPRCHGKGCNESWCKGRGFKVEESCPVCGGEYVGRFSWIQEVYGKKIDIAYYHRMADIPGVEINVGVRDNDHALLFRSDIGIEGLVMPLSKASG